jgi:hypothetical protein
LLGRIETESDPADVALFPTSGLAATITDAIILIYSGDS